MAADLSWKVDLDQMTVLSPTVESLESLVPPDVDLVEIDEPTGALEGTSRKRTVRVTRASTFAGRSGYEADFLDGWRISLPEVSAERSGDRCELRRGGSGFELKYTHFSTVQSKERRMPMLTAVNINGATAKSIKRTSVPWCFDGRLDVSDQIGDEVYAERKNVLDRGHMVRREDPNWDRLDIANRANTDTFHFTNSCPQMGAVNQQVWLGLENYILQNARAEELRATVFTGPAFTADDLPYRGALIPLSFWKVVAIVTEDGRPSATAYEVSQEDALSALEYVFGAYKTFQVSIRSIEEKTGIAFGDLADYDGFSASERKTGARRRAKLESLEMVRV
jgi:endonuclease G, mitochondrial